ncbi:MAG: hypothetical protein IIB57_08120 [Planctomycetes bacterium]|nr:hypothetical protein [Planctomycetota bacterium]
MTELTPIFDQVKAFVEQNASSGVVNHSMLVAVMFLAAGVGLSVLGAKLARPGVVVALGVLGAYGGLIFARESGFSSIVCTAVGAGMVGTIAHLTFRLWVGVAAAVVLSSVALGTFSYQQIVPHVASFQDSLTTDTGQFSLPSPAEQAEYRSRTPQQWANQFWAYVTARDAHVGRNGVLLGAGAALMGLFLGVVAMRWMLILSTSLVGTVFVTAAIGAIVFNLFPSYRSLEVRPAVLSAGMGGFLVASLILQTMLTRKAPTSSEKKADA